MNDVFKSGSQRSCYRHPSNFIISFPRNHPSWVGNFTLLQQYKNLFSMMHDDLSINLLYRPPGLLLPLTLTVTGHWIFLNFVNCSWKFTTFGSLKIDLSPHPLAGIGAGGWDRKWNGRRCGGCTRTGGCRLLRFRVAGRNRKTARVFIGAEVLPQYRWAGGSDVFDPFKNHLKARLAEHPLSAARPYHEIMELGYPGSSLVMTTGANVTN
jgi:hypothetical protein